MFKVSVNNVDCFTLQVMVLEMFPSNVKVSMSGGHKKKGLQLLKTNHF